MKILIVFLIVIFLVSFILVGIYLDKDNLDKEDEMEEETPKYQGPVRPTDDEEYFRETGITKPLEVKE